MEKSITLPLRGKVSWRSADGARRSSEEKKKETSAVKHKTAGNYLTGGLIKQAKTTKITVKRLILFHCSTRGPLR